MLYYKKQRKEKPITNQEVSKVAQAAAYIDVLANAGLIDNETENFCINKVKQLLDELLKEENKVQITLGPSYREDSVWRDKISTTDGRHPDAVINTTTVRNM